MVFALLRHLSARGRWIAGLVLIAAGLVLIGLSLAGVAGLLIHGVLCGVFGGVFVIFAVRRGRLDWLAAQAAEREHVAVR